MAVIAPMRPRRLRLLECDGLGSARKLPKYPAITDNKEIAMFWHRTDRRRADTVTVVPRSLR